MTATAVREAAAVRPVRLDRDVTYRVEARSEAVRGQQANSRQQQHRDQQDDVPSPVVPLEEDRSAGHCDPDGKASAISRQQRQAGSSNAERGDPRHWRLGHRCHGRLERGDRGAACESKQQEEHRHRIEHEAH